MALKADRHINCHGVFLSNKYTVEHLLRKEAVTLFHLIFKQGVKAVLAA